MKFGKDKHRKHTSSGTPIISELSKVTENTEITGDTTKMDEPEFKLLFISSIECVIIE